MKLLFDQNLSFRLVQRLQVEYPDSAQVRMLGMDTVSDREIWEYARVHDFTIVTQDGDFDQLSQVLGFPPKVIWLRCGNSSTGYIEQLLRVHHELIVAFGADTLVACLELI